MTAAAGGEVVGYARRASKGRGLAPIEALVGPARYPTVLARTAGTWGLAIVGIGLIVLLFPHARIDGLHAIPAELAGAAVLPLTGAMVARPTWFSPTLVKVIVLVAGVGLVVLIGLLGPNAQDSVATIPISAAFAVVFLGRQWFLAWFVPVAFGYGLVLGTQPDYPGALNKWLAVVGLAAAAAAVMGWVVGLIQSLAAQERANHQALEDTHRALTAAHVELAELSRTLEQRVAGQVGEIASLNRLRRFLSPQVAEAVVSSDDKALLAPHRRQIAVVFCDLRGFTSFAGGAEPEEVVAALDDYYNVVGDVLRSYDATVGSFAGDGIMAYFNDPVPCDDPAGRAVAMAIELRNPMSRLIEAWERKGFRLGYGIGISYGYATLGTIGFEGRNDYTALGSVVNLAARLCGEAATGEILIDQRANDALGDRIEIDRRVLNLKGIAEPVTAFLVSKASASLRSMGATESPR